MSTVNPAVFGFTVEVMAKSPVNTLNGFSLNAYFSFFGSGKLTLTVSTVAASHVSFNGIRYGSSGLFEFK